MSRRAQCLLYLQYLIGVPCIFIVGPIVILLIRCMGYRVKDIKKTREVVKNLYEEHGGPWIICPNHLTMIDSAIVAYAMMPIFRYMLHYRLLPWNLPESANFQKNVFLTISCYLTKCIPISRGGDREKMRNTLDKCLHLLTKKEKLMVFPEGGRSRTGRVDTQGFSYGVGRFVTTVPECRVMCVYLRGDSQEAYSTVPRFGERFTINIETLRPASESKGLKAQRDCARQIIDRLARMEEDYFAVRG